MDKKKRARFKADHPRCIFCGGFGLNETVEHCPPQSLFLFSDWPDGFTYPACTLCNKGTSDYDLLIALLARTGTLSKDADSDGKLTGLIRRANRRYPGIIERMTAGVRARKTAPTGSLDHVVNNNGLLLTDEHHDAMRVFASKLAKSVYYKETKWIFPHTGCILYTWESNIELFRQGYYTNQESLKHIGKHHPITSGNNRLDDQFDLEVAFSDPIMAVRARFTSAFHINIFASTEPEQLDQILNDISRKNGKPHPFSWSQWCPVATP